MERVVVTGIGVVSSIGIGKKNFWQNLLAGKSGISSIEAFDASGYPTQVGGEIKGFNPEKHMNKKSANQYGRASQFAVVAAELALEDSGITLNDVSNEKNIDVIVGTTMGETQAIETMDSAWVKTGEQNVQQQWISQYPGNTLAMSVARELDLTGLSIVIPTACSAGNYGIGYGHDLIKNGQSVMVIAGGSDAFSRIAFTGFNRMYAMASSKCCPFDKKREGMLLGEGAGFVVLEPLTSAMKREAHIYAEVLGYGLSCDAAHMTIPHEEGVAQVIRKAIKLAGIEAADVDYISAHGTGTPINDKTESGAINRLRYSGSDPLSASMKTTTSEEGSLFSKA